MGMIGELGLVQLFVNISRIGNFDLQCLDPGKMCQLP